MADAVMPLPRPESFGFKVARRVLWASLYVPVLRDVVARAWPPVTVTHQGARFRVFAGRNHQDRTLWSTGRFVECRSVAAMCDAVRGKRCLIVDIGANSGIYTVMLARSAGEGSQVLAIEPNPVLQRQLRENIVLNDLEARVTVHGVALGDHEGTATLHTYAINLGQSSLRTDRAGKREITVPLRPLATLMPPRGDFERIVMKIDVEGVEDRVLLPFFDTATDDQLPDTLLIETAHGNDWNPALMARIDALGYRPRFTAEGNTLYDRDRAAGPDTPTERTATV
ncbi:FkbM family methyltransferase [Anianabacter salinae]|uniref:FkbM family methyltransferase n=1 Tax=Anianabacter salinae TaxID=2851023 RepID=UPI00225E2827|nr:FkbM family methyltransferase [Anianabacter salinae]MBV0913012.1 FkbM family methyltransferase [Anianabacter salinae]